MESSTEDEGFLLRSQLSKLQLAVQHLSKENSRLKLENELLLQHTLPPPRCPSPPPYPHPPYHKERVEPGHLALPSPPRYPASMPHVLPPVGFEMQSALEEVRMLQQRLELLKGKLGEQEEQPALQHPQCHPPSPPPGGPSDFFDLVEQLNSYRGRQSPNRPQRSNMQPGPRPGWRSPNALPRSPVHRTGTSPCGHSGQYSPSAKGAYSKGGLAGLPRDEECKWEQEVSTNEEPPERCECKAPLRHSQQAVVAPRSKVLTLPC